MDSLTDSPQVDRVAAALEQRDALVGPYGQLADKLTLMVTSCICTTDEKEKRHFEVRFSWCDPAVVERQQTAKPDPPIVIKVGTWKGPGPMTITLPSTGLDVSPVPANKQEDAWEVGSRWPSECNLLHPAPCGLSSFLPTALLSVERLVL